MHCTDTLNVICSFLVKADLAVVSTVSHHCYAAASRVFPNYERQYFETTAVNREPIELALPCKVVSLSFDIERRRILVCTVPFNKKMENEPAEASLYIHELSSPELSNRFTVELPSVFGCHNSTVRFEGQRLLFCTAADGSLHLYDTVALESVQLPFDCAALYSSPCGARLACVSNSDEMRVYDSEMFLAVLQSSSNMYDSQELRYTTRGGRYSPRHTPQSRFTRSDPYYSGGNGFTEDEGAMHHAPTPTTYHHHHDDNNNNNDRMDEGSRHTYNNEQHRNSPDGAPAHQSPHNYYGGSRHSSNQSPRKPSEWPQEVVFRTMIPDYSTVWHQLCVGGYSALHISDVAATVLSEGIDEPDTRDSQYTGFELPSSMAIPAAHRASQEPRKRIVDLSAHFNLAHATVQCCSYTDIRDGDYDSYMIGHFRCGIILIVDAERAVVRRVLSTSSIVPPHACVLNFQIVIPNEVYLVGTTINTTHRIHFISFDHSLSSEVVVGPPSSIALSPYEGVMITAQLPKDTHGHHPLLEALVGGVGTAFFFGTENPRMYVATASNNTAGVKLLSYLSVGLVSASLVWTVSALIYNGWWLHLQLLFCGRVA